MSDKQLEQFKAESNSLVDQSKSLMVIQGNNRFILRDEAEREIAGILLKEAHELEKKIKEHYKPIENAHKETGRQIKKAKDDQLSGPVKAKQILSQGIGEYEAKIHREAEEKARQERERIEAERLVEAERKQKEAEALKETGNPDDMTAALNLETEAEDILDLPDPVVEVKKPDKISGIKQRRYIKCEVKDEYTLKQHILNQIAPDSQRWEKTKVLFGLLCIDSSAVRKYVKILDEAGKTITEIKAMFPGLHVWVDYKATT